MEVESLEQMQARHRKEQRDLQSRITSKKKNGTKKTRKGVNDECVELEKQLRERQAGEVAGLLGGGEDEEVEEEEELVKGLEGVNISETETQQPIQQTQPQRLRDEINGGGSGGAGKKRNRQKDRLARRAAEQEAAAIAAEEEVRNMTDHRGEERKAMVEQFERFGLVEKEIAPDGHCLFSAVADQLGYQGLKLGGDGEGKGVGYKIVRGVAAGYMAEHGEDYEPFMEEALGSYVDKIRDTAEWGGQLELSALARAYGVEIRVIKTGGLEVVKPGEKEGEKEGEGVKTLWLAYYRHGFGLGEHYNSLRKGIAA